MLQAKPYPKSLIITLCFLCTATFLHAQVKITDSVDLEPYKSVLSKGYKTQGKIKEEIYLRKMKKGDSKADTIYVVRFDEAGKRLSYAGPDINGKKITADYTYHNKPGVKEYWQDENYSQGGVRRIIDSVFDKKGLILTVKSTSVVNGDTVARYVYDFTYDAVDNITSRKYFINSQQVGSLNYEYSNGKLIKQIETGSSAAKNVHTEILMTYDDAGRLSKKETYSVQDSTPTLLRFNKYSYTGNKLTAEIYGDIPKLDMPVEVAYKYNEDNTISKITIRRDTAHREIKYSYDKGRLVRIHSYANVLHDLVREIFPPDPEYRTPPPVTYDQEYKYDQYGNLLEQTAMVNGKLRILWSYVRQYY